LKQELGLMPELTYYVACTVDGFIAGEDGSFDCFLSEGEHLQDLCRNFPETIPTHLRAVLKVEGENRSFDTVLMGRNTWEVGARLGIRSPYGHLRQYLFSRTMRESPDPGVELVASDPAAFVRQLKQAPGKGIWLCGGAELAAALFDLIDEFIVKVNPVIIGSGIPLLAGAVKPAALRLVSSQTYPNRFVMLRYRRKD
jgi:dihydrofolate reductase